MKLLDDVEGVERDKAVFECDVNDPEAEVKWFRGDKVRKILTKICSIQINNQYTIHTSMTAHTLPFQKTSFILKQYIFIAVQEVSYILNFLKPC